MYGRIKYKYFNSCRLGCCTIDLDKATVKRAEESLAFRDAEEEMAHPIGTICDDPYGCHECQGEDYEHYDNADLDNIRGVWCNVDWRTVEW
jgi:hypothetical protein